MSSEQLNSLINNHHQKKYKTQVVTEGIKDKRASIRFMNTAHQYFIKQLIDKDKVQANRFLVEHSTIVFAQPRNPASKDGKISNWNKRQARKLACIHVCMCKQAESLKC